MKLVNRLEIYKKEITNLPKIDDRLVLMGAGGIGSWAGLYAVLMGIKKFLIFDGDTIELSNLNRTPYKIDQVGMNKAEALKELLLERRPDIEVVSIPEYYDPDLHSILLSESDYVLVATDDLNTKRQYFDNALNAIVVSNDGSYILISDYQFWKDRWTVNTRSEYRAETSAYFSSLAGLYGILALFGYTKELPLIISVELPFVDNDLIFKEKPTPELSPLKKIYAIKEVNLE